MTNWKPVKYIKTSDAGPFENHKWEFEITLPEPLANWDVFDYWEKERVHSMRDNLTSDDILFDVGAEHGWMSVVFAKFCKVFLVEPTPEFWPNIRETWFRNVTNKPEGCFCGLIGEKSNCKPKKFDWPDESFGELIDKNKYLYLNESPADTKILSIDDLVEMSHVTPTALTIDVEGYELAVLKGSHKLLSENNIKLWVSIHPDLAEKAGFNSDDVYKYMESLGYKNEFVAKDHEIHMYYTKND